MNVAITRRRMLWLLVALGGAVGLARFARVPPFRDTARSPLEAVFGHPDSARRIGEAYLSRYPQEADAALLRTRIAGSPEDATRVLDGMRGGELAGWVRDRQREDFRDGRTVVVDGWMLSSTEARLCALLSLE